MIFWICFSLLWIPIRILFPMKVIGMQNIKKDEGAVLTCNHYSNIDPVLLDISLNKKLRFLGKRELFKNKVVGFFLKKFGGYPINREKPEMSAIKFALGALKEKKLLAIFPEGTRNKGEDETQLVEIKNGAIMFASKSDSPIIPMILYKRPRVFRKNYLLIGEPIKIDGENSKKLTPEEVDINARKLLNEMDALRDNMDSLLKDKKKK